MDDIPQSLTRRAFVLALVSALAAVPFAPARADGGGDGGNDGGGGGDGGGGDGGGDDGGGDGGDDHGDGGDQGEDNDSRNRIREAVRNGDASPLKDILAVVRKSYKGQVLRVRVSGRGSGMVYRIRILDPDNRVIEVRVNAKSRRILGATGV